MSNQARTALVATIASLLASPSLQALMPTAEDAPKLTLTEPTKDQKLKGRTTIKLEYERGKNAIKQIEFLVDGKPNYTDTGKFQDRGELTYNFHTTMYLDGTHKLTVKIVDTEDAAQSAEIEFAIANKPSQ